MKRGGLVTIRAHRSMTRAGVGDGDAYVYFNWKSAHRKAWKPASRDMALFRLEKAEALGLTYEEYTLEILERGRYLSSLDVERIDAIKRKRDL